MWWELFPIKSKVKRNYTYSWASLVGKVSGVQIAQVSGAPYQSTKIHCTWCGLY